MKKQQSNLKKSLTQADLQAVGDLMGGLIDKQSAVLASKKDLKELEVRINTRMDEGFESVSVIEGIDSLAEKLADKEKLERIVEWAITVGEKVGVRPKV
ncbi:MAG: hypothetical protein WC794_02275 [Candidatus Doudnabacteria bacterium]|jgi:hypothetical protein